MIDTWAKAGHPNENPAEALGVQPLKRGVLVLMTRTGQHAESWSWAYKYISQVNKICSTPVLGWKTPISVRHGYTPDISAWLQYEHWEKVYFKVDEQSPHSKEAPGYWLCVSEHVGDLMTFDIWSDATKQVIQRSAIRSADPKKGSIRNKRVNFEVETNQEDPEIIDADGEMPSLA